MKRRDLLAHLSSHGCELVQEGAKHSWWENPANGRRSAVPRQHQESTITAHLDSQDLRLGLLRFRTGFPRWLCWRSAGSRLLVLGGHPTLEFGNNSHCGVEELLPVAFQLAQQDFAIRDIDLSPGRVVKPSSRRFRLSKGIQREYIRLAARGLFRKFAASL